MSHHHADLKMRESFPQFLDTSRHAHILVEPGEGERPPGITEMEFQRQIYFELKTIKNYGLTSVAGFVDKVSHKYVPKGILSTRSNHRALPASPGAGAAVNWATIIYVKKATAA